MSADEVKDDVLIGWKGESFKPSEVWPGSQDDGRTGAEVDRTDTWCVHRSAAEKYIAVNF